MHLANYTRLDIAFAVHYFAWYQQKPELIHFVMVKRIFRYLNGTRTCRLKFDKNSPTVLESYVDASYKDDPQTTRSTTGYVILDWLAIAIIANTCEIHYSNCVYHDLPCMTIFYFLLNLLKKHSNWKISCNNIWRKWSLYLTMREYYYSLLRSYLKNKVTILMDCSKQSKSIHINNWQIYSPNHCRSSNSAYFVMH